MRERYFFTPYPIPEIGAEEGDAIVVRPAHLEAPLTVVKRFGHHTLVRFMGAGHLDRLDPVEPGDPYPPKKPHEWGAGPAPALRVLQGGA